MAKLLTTLIVTILVTTATCYNIKPRYHESTGLNVFELAAQHGYPMEAHEIETEDGYLLGVQRIPHGKNNKHLANKPPVFMMHGLASCSADWINGGPDASLAYRLADLGYDVWMGNARGTAESRKHKTLDPDTDKKEFWNFSWNEIGRYDLPAMIDYVLAHTGNEQLQYVGYSQGTTTFFVMASTRPEYNAKVKLMTALAPAAEMRHAKHPLLLLIAPYVDTIYKVAEALQIREIVPRTEFLLNLTKVLCIPGQPTQELCNIVVFLIAGYDRQQLDENFVTVIATNSPAGANLKQFLHYAQIKTDTEFRNWDYYDEAKNMEVYGSAIPPVYDLSQVTVPVAIYYGENDWLVSETDVQSLSKKLPNLVESKLVNYKAFTHIDFIWAIDVNELLYDEVVAIMEQYH